MPGVVLVTGAGRPIGARLAVRLSVEHSIERIIAVDTVPPPEPLGRAEFVRADIRHPLIGKVIDQARVDTLVHPRSRDAGDTGTHMLLAAGERARSLTRVVAESSTAVYDSSGAGPSVWTEELRVDDRREEMLRAFGRSRPDVTVTVLRMADLVGPGIDSTVMRQLARPVITTVLGFDPLLQLLHVDDAVEVLAQACIERHPGPTNVAGDGVLTLSQLARRAGKLRLAAPARVVGGDVARLRFGRVVETRRLATRFGYLPRYSTAEALDAVIGTHRSAVPALALAAVGVAQRAIERSG